VETKILKIDERRPHVVSELICVKCFKRWVGVRPEGVFLRDLECENCGAGYAIETGERVIIYE